jgi:hypothetical protein
MVLQNEIINGFDPSHQSLPTSGQLFCPVPLFDVAVQPCFLKKLNFLTTAGYLINLA